MLPDSAIGSHIVYSFICQHQHKSCRSFCCCCGCFSSSQEELIEKSAKSNYIASEPPFPFQKQTKNEYKKHNVTVHWSTVETVKWNKRFSVNVCLMHLLVFGAQNEHLKQKQDFS